MRAYGVLPPTITPTIELERCEDGLERHFKPHFDARHALGFQLREPEHRLVVFSNGNFLVTFSALKPAQHYLVHYAWTWPFIWSAGLGQVEALRDS